MLEHWVLPCSCDVILLKHDEIWIGFWFSLGWFWILFGLFLFLIFFFAFCFGLFYFVLFLDWIDLFVLGWFCFEFFFLLLFCFELVWFVWAVLCYVTNIFKCPKMFWFTETLNCDIWECSIYNSVFVFYIVPRRSWIACLRMLLTAVFRMIIPSVRWPPASCCPLEHTALSTAGGGGTHKHASLWQASHQDEFIASTGWNTLAKTSNLIAPTAN